MVFVSLAPLADPALVASAIAERLGVRERAEQSLRDALITHLAGKRLLLVLDNCEHVLPAAPLVAAAPRGVSGPAGADHEPRPLHLSGEHLYPVSPLALPDAGRLPPLAELGQTAAVRLFVERVRAVKPDFALSEANAPAVVEIVRRLDGLPLALELAAARARVLSPAALAARLERSLPLLTGGAQDLPDRQRTLRETIAWSYDLLGPRSRPSFAASASSPAAAPWRRPRRSPIWTRRSMCWRGWPRCSTQSAAARGAGREPRYTMLATIREFALERLSESGEEPATRRSPRRGSSCDLARTRGPEIVETVDPALLDVIEREHDNLRAALAWSRDDGRPRHTPPPGRRPAISGTTAAT